MLILSRKRNECAILTLPDGRRCRIACVDIRGDKVRLGFEFPDDVKIHREEVQKLIDDPASAGGVKPSGYEPVRGDVPADALLPSHQNLRQPEGE